MSGAWWRGCGYLDGAQRGGWWYGAPVEDAIEPSSLIYIIGEWRIYYVV